MSKPTLMIKGNLYSDKEEINRELRDFVPLRYILDWIKIRIPRTGIKNRVLILKSETASGKSTMLPPEIYNEFTRRGTSGRGIICTQPRTLTAIENVYEILKNYSSVLRLGETIGYSTRYNKLGTSRESLLSATVGTLAQMLAGMTDDEICARFQFILLDEVHERELPTDLTIFYVKSFLSRVQNRQDCPFVFLMSATFDQDVYLEYFQLPESTNFIWCKGARAKIVEIWPDHDYKNYILGCAEIAEKISLQPDQSGQTDLLIFLPGSKEQIECKNLLRVVNEKNIAAGEKVFSQIVIDGEAVRNQNYEYRKLINIPLSAQGVTAGSNPGEFFLPTRRIILSTNVAETGLTLPELRYVIDSGLNREIEFNPVVGCVSLLTKPSPKSRIVQRRGRAGRKHEGVFYPVYRKEIYDHLPTVQFPQIVTTECTEFLLSVAAESDSRIGRFNLADFDLLDWPSADSIRYSMRKLRVLGFISSAGIISPSGKLASRLSISVETVRLILSGYFWGVSVTDLISVAAFLQPDCAVFLRDAKWDYIYRTGLPGWYAEDRNILSREQIADHFFDFLVLWHSFSFAIKSGGGSMIENARSWETASGVSAETLIFIVGSREDIAVGLIVEGLSIGENPNTMSLIELSRETFHEYIRRIKYCIYDSYRHNLICRDIGADGPPVYRNASGQKISVGDKMKRCDAFVCSSLKLKGENVYKISAVTISVLDDFICPDKNFD